ncbi:thiol reductant ABC exporter subunit CydC [Ancylobacter pratisalsi]|uniref:Thiol reductant ABC exporter subunit CydC n=2 Tax=Ancylobacter pratisalsi TaxID=1745854 RepID=A0A6P1YTF7_9HYPH|nr:thiol reductant ABC exporter subunit CydC [Ancylobacter pratisalsi]
MAVILRLFLSERRIAFFAGAALAALTLLAGASLLALSGWFITATAIAGMSAAAAATFDVFAPSAGIRLAALVRTAARYGERLVTHDAALAVLAGLRERLFRGWAAPEAAGRLADRPTRLLFRLTLDIDALDSLYLRVLVPVIAAVVATLGVTVLIGLIRVHTALTFVLIVLGVGALIPWIALRAARRPARRRAHALEVLRSRAVDLFAGQTELIMAGRLAARREELRAADQRLAAADDALNRVETFVSAGFSAASAVLLALALLAVAALNHAGTIDTPAAALVLLLALAAFDPFAALRRGVVELERALIAARRLASRLTPTPPIAPMPTPGKGQAVEVRNLAIIRDGAVRPSLEGIDLAIAEGERVALVGMSGAGKSTLLAAIAGEIGPASGEVAARRSVLLTQRTELFHDSLRGNLLVADPAADDDRLMAALTAAGLGAVVAALPEGLDTPLGEGGLGLSGGQSRRLALSRLFLTDAPLWLLDEPTEGLDGATARDVLARLAHEAGSRTLILATHLRREAQAADRLILIAEGRARGSYRRGDPGFAAAIEALRPD